MEKILNIAIIGCGRVAGHHARAVQQIPSLKLVAASDINPERANSFAETFGIPVYENYYTMLQEKPEIDIVAVITPSGMHFEHAMDVVENFQKHVVIEKPTVMRLTHGAELAAAAERNGVQVFPVFQYRFNKCIQRVRRAIQDGELGNIFLATVRLRWCRPQSYYDRDAWRGTFALDGGACTNQGIHHLDLLRYFAGEVTEVNAQMKTFGANIEVEDTVVANLKFESGALGVVEITTAARPTDYESSLSILGDKGLAMIGGWATSRLISFSPDPAEEEANSEEFPDPYGYGHITTYKAAYDTIVNGGTPAVTYEDAMKTIGLLHSVYRSDEVCNWVNVAEGKESARLGQPNEEVAKLYRTEKP